METNNNIVNQNIENPQNQPKKSKVLMIVVIVLVLSALGYGGYYLYNNYYKADKPSDSQSLTTSQANTQTSTVATTEEISTDLKSIDVNELKQAVTELKETISSFGQ